MQACKDGKISIEECIGEPKVFDEVKMYFTQLGYKTETRFVSGYDQDFLYLIIECNKSS